MNFDSLLGAGVALAVWAVPMFSLLAVIYIARRWYHERDRRNPLTRGLLRGPGHSLRELADDLRFELIFYPAMLGAIPVVVLAIYSMRARAGGLTTLEWILIALSTVGVLVFGGVKIFRITKQLRNLRLGFEAETAIGQELNLLMKDGFSVFHDVPGEKNFNIDHVVVGPSGVFAVETKGRAKPISADGMDTHRVRYNGKQLEFPGWCETKPLEQAQRQAAWLRNWLSSAVGDPVDVRPVLMLPGWFVDRTAPPGLAVMNGTNCRNFFLKERESELDAQLLRRIAHQLDTRCRDVEPTTYKPLPA